GGRIFHSPNKSPLKERAEKCPRIQPANEFEVGSSGNLSDTAEWGSAEEQDAEARYSEEPQSSDGSGPRIHISDRTKIVERMHLGSKLDGSDIDGSDSDWMDFTSPLPGERSVRLLSRANLTHDHHSSRPPPSVTLFCPCT